MYFFLVLCDVDKRLRFNISKFRSNEDLAATITCTRIPTECNTKYELYATQHYTSPTEGFLWREDLYEAEDSGTSDQMQYD